MRSIGDVLGDAMRSMDLARKRWERRKREFLDAGGRCVSCLDSGYRTGRFEADDPDQCCPDCATGSHRLGSIRQRLVERLASTSTATPRSLPLDTMRCARVEQTQAAIV